jgi:dihydrodipicolinate synthase/N-acetylneuraminate lyase
VRYGIGGLKAALDMIGFEGGQVRAPLQMPDEEARSEISRVLQQAALSRDDLSETEFRTAGALTE